MSGLITTEEYVKNVGPYLNKKNLSPDEFKIEFLKIVKKYWKLYNDTNYIIESLKKRGYKVYLLSNINECAYMGFKELFDINKFDKVYLSYQIHMLKPDKTTYQNGIANNEYIITKHNDYCAALPQI